MMDVQDFSAAAGIGVVSKSANKREMGVCDIPSQFWLECGHADRIRPGGALR
jgi:hypothetical protein